MKRLDGKVAIITGSGQGIGAAYAVGFAKEGAKIVVADMLDGSKTVEAVKNVGSDAIYVKADVTDQASAEALMKAAYDKFGSVDILLNNAAIFGSIVMKPFSEYSMEEFMTVLKVNTWGPFCCMKAVFPYMKEKGGKIINIGSSSINEGVPGMPHYVASKAAVLGMTRSMAREMGDYKINVNTIMPGLTQSPGGKSFAENQKLGLPPIEEMMKQGRCIKRSALPEDLIGVALFFASDDSAFITGQSIIHDGGLCFQ